jgi:polysaccharide export outer membrane protein
MGLNKRVRFWRRILMPHMEFKVMKFPRNRVSAALLLAGLSGVLFGFGSLEARAQQAPPASSNTATPPLPSLQPSPMAQLKALEPDSNEEYTLSGGDEISVQVAGRPELSGKYMVGPDGRISLPTAGTLDLSGMTREQAAAAVNKAYGEYYKMVSASVSIDKYGSNRVMVIGAVEHPGFINFDQQPTLLQAITEAGVVQQAAPQGAIQGASKGGVGTPVRSFTDSLPEECFIYRGPQGSQTVYKVNVRDLLSSGNAMADVRLRRNDMIVVPDQRERYVSVQGEVHNPGLIVLTHTSTLPSVLAQAGGLTDNAGTAEIEIVDPATGKTRYVKFKELLTPQGVNEVSLQPGEVIYVPKRGIARMGYIFQQLSPVTSIMSIAALAAVQ